jgi:hypothetical protein
MLYKTLFVIGCGVAQASYERIAGYEPGSQVTDHNAIDLDQKAMETALGFGTTASFVDAKACYEQGGNSKVYVQYTVPALAATYAKSEAVTGATSSVVAKLKDGEPSGETTVKVQYKTTDVQASYVACKPAADLPAVATADQVVSGCLHGTYSGDSNSIEDIAVGNSGPTTMTPTAATTKAGRTLQGFSTGISGKALTGCPGCPYKDMLMFYNYYGSASYGDDWIQAAFASGPTSFTNGNADFTGASFDTRSQAIKKGSAYMNVWMYVMREFEDALDDCVVGTSLAAANDDPVHAWDEGVAFYSGSLTGTDAVASTGKMVYALAEKRCKNFKTCGTGGDQTTGTSKVNFELSQAFAAGKHALLSGYCSAARPYVERIADLMSIPLIQGTIKYAHTMGTAASLAGVSDAAKAEAAVFAAAILPRVHHCSASAATTIYDNVKLGTTSVDFAAVKAAFESVYSCLNLTCMDVGGFIQSGTTYFSGAEPCNDALPPPSAPPTPVVETDKTPGWAVVIIIIIGAMCVVFSLSFFYLIQRERAGKPIFLNLAGSKGGAA